MIAGLILFSNIALKNHAAEPAVVRVRPKICSMAAIVSGNIVDGTEGCAVKKM
jgi:hypothetical protein